MYALSLNFGKVINKMRITIANFVSKVICCILETFSQTIIISSDQTLKTFGACESFQSLISCKNCCFRWSVSFLF